MKQRLLDLIDAYIVNLNDEDITGHIYWNQFKELVESVPEDEEFDLLNEPYTDHPQYQEAELSLFERMGAICKP